MNKIYRTLDEAMQAKISAEAKFIVTVSKVREISIDEAYKRWAAESSLGPASQQQVASLLNLVPAFMR